MQKFVIGKYKEIGIQSLKVPGCMCYIYIYIYIYLWKAYAWLGMEVSASMNLLHTLISFHTLEVYLLCIITFVMAMYHSKKHSLLV